MAGQEVDQKVLSARLFLRDRSSAPLISLLREQIVNGRLGKFKVVAFPDRFKGLPPVYYCLKFNLFFNSIIAIPFYYSCQFDVLSCVLLKIYMHGKLHKKLLFVFLEHCIRQM